MSYFIAGTGTRQIQLLPNDEKDEVVAAIRAYLESFLDEEPIVISGMAEGFDSALAHTAVMMEIPFIACVPNRGYGRYYWGQKSLTRRNREDAFNALLSKAIQVEYTNEVLGVSDLYYNGIHMNFHRNHRMVDLADEVVAWGIQSRGTSECVAYARRVGKKVVILG